MKLTIKNVFVFTTLLLSGDLYAEVLWQNSSVSLLRGNDYRVGDAERQVLTFENTAGTTWGDSFLFLDHSRSSTGDTGNYAEWSPRLSLGKVSEQPMTLGIIKDVLVATTVEMPSHQTNYLYGVGVDLALPRFNFAQLNLYRRQNENSADNWQVTAVWAVPFTLFNQQWLYDGFIDWASASSDQAANLNFTSQLKFALHPHFNLKDKLYLGIEYAYWTNKYGIADSPAFRTNESNLNLLLKWHF